MSKVMLLLLLLSNDVVAKQTYLKCDIKGSTVSIIIEDNALDDNSGRVQHIDAHTSVKNITADITYEYIYYMYKVEDITRYMLINRFTLRISKTEASESDDNISVSIGKCTVLRSEDRKV